VCEDKLLINLRMINVGGRLMKSLRLIRTLVGQL
jgi:hypothetical protein